MKNSKHLFLSIILLPFSLGCRVNSSLLLPAGLKSFATGLKTVADSMSQEAAVDRPPSLKMNLKEVAARLGPDFAGPFRPSDKDDICPVAEQMNDMMSMFSMGVFINSLGLDPHDEDHRVPLLSLQVKTCGQRKQVFDVSIPHYLYKKLLC
jgi:hypothetical protein